MTLKTLCKQCSWKLDARPHGAPDKNYCEECDIIHHSTDLDTYEVPDPERAA